MAISGHFLADADEFLSDFADSATYTTTGGVVSSVDGIFADASKDLTPGMMPVENQEPTFFCKTSDVVSAVNGETFVIDGTTYYQIKNDPDGTGFSRITLSKDTPHGKQ